MADRYWVGGTASWDGTVGTKWATTSGGAGGASIPTSSDNALFDANSGTGTITVAAGNTGCLNLDFTGAGALTFAGSAALDIRGSLVLVAAMTRTYTGAITFSATDSRTLTFGTKTTASAATFSGSGGTWTVQDAWNNGTATITHTAGTIDFNGQTINCGSVTSSGTTTRTMTMGASTITLSANADWLFSGSNLTFNANTSTVEFSSGTCDITSDGATFYNILDNSTSSCGNLDALTCTNLEISPASGASKAWSMTGNITVTGTFTVTGASAIARVYVRTIVTSSSALTITAAAVSLTNVDFQRVTAAGAAAPFTGTTIGNCGGNTNITATTAVDRYWVDVNGGNFSATASWSATSGGASGASVPLPQDTAYFDANSITSGGSTITIDSSTVSPRICKMDFTGILNTPTLAITPNAVDMYGNWTFVAGMSVSSGTAGMNMDSSGFNLTFTSGGLTIDHPITLNGVGSTLTLGGDLNISTRTITVTRGTFNANNYNVTATSVSSSSTVNDRGISMGSGTWTLTGTGTVWNLANLGPIVLTPSTSTIKFTDSSATARTFAGGGGTYNNFWHAPGAGTASLTISGSNTFADFKDDGTAAHSILFTAGTTQTVTTFTVSGNSGQLITLNSTTTAVYNITKTTGVVSRDYLNIQHCRAGGGATFYAGANSVNNQGDASAGYGWHFTVPDESFTFTKMLTQ